MGLKHQAAAARKWRTAIRQVRGHFPAYLPPALFLTDPKRVPDPVAVVPTLPHGVGVIYRHFGAKDRGDMAAKLRAVCNQDNRLLLIAADPDLAREVGADGVHWPEVRLHQARQWRGRFFLQTASAHSIRAIHRIDRAGLDAALVSTVFASQSPSASSAMGAHRFRQIAQTNLLPVYGLGGICAQNAEAIARSGGLAAIEGFLPQTRTS